MEGIFEDISNAFRKSNNQTVQIIIICILVFVGKMIVDFSLSFFPYSQYYIDSLSLNFYLSSDFQTFLTHFWTLLIFPFTNGGFLDLIFNIIALYWVGNLLKEFIGGHKIFVVYIFGAFFAAAFFFLVYGLAEPLTHKSLINIFLKGNSAGIFAVMFATVALLPLFEMNVFGIIVKFKYLALGFLLVTFFNPPIGVLNLGGAIFGYLNIKFWRTGWDITSPAENLIDWMAAKKHGNQKIKVKTYSSSAASIIDNKQEAYDNNVPEQEEVDKLLDKISRSGYESLSTVEKRKLYWASQKKD